jgi:hypothetical protein
MVTARRLMRWVMGAVAVCCVVVPVPAYAATSSTTPDAPTTTIVESGGPPRPEVGPIVVPADGSSFGGAWWLVAFGGVQLVGLFFITRRARARLATEDAQP